MTINTGNEMGAVVLERIQKLLALTTSPNTNEAANAAAKVQELLDSHNLSMSQVTAHESNAGGSRSRLAVTSHYHSYGSRSSPMNQAWQWLMNVLGEQHRCQTFTGPSRDPRTGKTSSVFVVVGDPTNVQATVTLFEWLRGLLEAEATKQWRTYAEYLRDHDRYQGSPVSFRINFVHGAATEIGRIMRSRRRRSEHAAAITALATDYKAAINEYMESNFEMREGKEPDPKVNADFLAQGMGRETGARLERMNRSLEEAA